ncbi:hypothetical protein ACJX0J_018945, partial [Zea mays]
MTFDNIQYPPKMGSFEEFTEWQTVARDDDALLEDNNNNTHDEDASQFWTKGTPNIELCHDRHAISILDWVN